MAARTTNMWAPAGLLVALAGFALMGCTNADSQSVESDLTGCEGAYVDSGGRCRLPNGRFAKKVCCAVPATPTERRNLDAYVCPDGTEDIAVAFFDADSTLRISKSGYYTAKSADDVNVLPFAARTISERNADGFLVAIVSNQGGVAAGHIEFEVAQEALAFAASQLATLGAKIDYLDFADQRDGYRKPETGMATQLDQALVDACGRGIDWSSAFMVGDAGYQKGVDGPHPDGRPADDFSNSDRLFAENLGIAFFEPTDYFGWREFGFYNLRYESELLGLLDAIEVRIAELEASGEDPELLATLQDELDDIRSVNGFE